MRYGLSVLWFLFLLASTCAFIAGVEASERELADLTIVAFKDRCERLRSGVYRAWGRIEEDEGEPQQVRTYDVEVFSAFNNMDHLLRVDRSQKLTSGPPLRPSLPAGKVVYRYCQAPDRTMLWSSEGRDLGIYRQLSANDVATDYKPLFDVRTIGLVSYHGLSERFEKVLQLLLARPPEAAKESDGTVRLRWTGPTSPFVTSIWLDERNGCTPVRMEVRGTMAKEPKCVTEITWTQVSGAWVPKSFLLKERLRLHHSITYALAFDWEAVNLPVPSAEFSWQGFHLPNGAKVVDFRLGRNHPVTVAVVGQSVVRMSEPASADWVRLISVFASIFGIVAVVVVLWLRQRQRQRSENG